MKVVPAISQILIAVVLLCGCQNKEELLNSSAIPTEEPAEVVRARIDTLATNAMINNMSLTDIHFVAHTAELNGQGHRWMTRYADHLAEYGGALRFEPRGNDEESNAARVETMRNFLASSGISMQRITVDSGLPSGTGLAATEAILVKERLFSPESSTMTLGGDPGTFTPGS